MSTTEQDRVVQPYLFFNGRCEEALAFYRKAIGAEVLFSMRYNESPEPLPPGRLAPGFENKIMHASFQVGQTRLMASDACSPENARFEGFQLALTVPSEADADRVFAGLCDGGKVEMPLAKTFWSPRFGIGWMVMVRGQES